MFDKINIKKFAAVTAMIMVASFAIAALIFFGTGGVNGVLSAVNGSTKNVNIERVVDFEGINNISVDTSSIDIIFIPENREDVKLHLSGYTTEGEPRLKAETNSDTLNIYTRVQEENRAINFGFTTISLKLNIYLPENYSKDISIKTSSGDVKISGLNLNSFNYHASSGDLLAENFIPKNSMIETSSGEVRLNGFGGDLQLKTSSGDAAISYSGESKNTNITTSSGEVTLRNFTGSLNGRSQSGDLRVEYLRLNNNVNLKSSSGEIDLILPGDSQFGIKVNTSSGDIRTDFTVAQSGEIREDKLEGTVGSSESQIVIESSSGDVNIGK